MKDDEIDSETVFPTRWQLIQNWLSSISSSSSSSDSNNLLNKVEGAFSTISNYN